ncbi:MAG: Uma2 family endonuclease [Anaerolineae bacterium]
MMMELIAQTDVYTPAGDIIAANVSEDDYMARYAADHCEWVRGFVIKMSPTTDRHWELVFYLGLLLKAYLELRPIGTVRGEPFVMKLSKDSRREPDLMVILQEHANRLTTTHLQGPADICIEVVSPESYQRDRVDKLYEYQKGGVTEYWIIDPHKQEALFYRRDKAGVYVGQPLEGEHYRPLALPGFALHVPTLWQDSLPQPGAVVSAVSAMLA